MLRGIVIALVPQVVVLANNAFLNKARNACGSWTEVCNSCPGGTGECMQCASDPSKWQCGDGDHIPSPTPNPPAPTPRPTSSAPTPTAAPQTPSPPTSSTPSAPPVAGVCGAWTEVCNSCPGGPGACMQCTSDPSKWQCGEVVDFPTPNPPAPTPSPPAPTPKPTTNSPAPTPSPPVPTPKPTPNPPAPTMNPPAPTPKPTPNPQATCGTWNQVCPGCAACKQCETDPAKWQCGSGDPTPLPPTLAPTTAAPTSPATPAPPTPPTSTGGYCKPVANDADCSFIPGAGISAWFTEAMYDQMFPNMCATGCSGCGLLTYNCMVAATILFPEIASSSDTEANKRELAAWLGIMSQETTGGGCSQPVTDIGDGQCQCSPTWCDDHPNGGCAAWGMCKIAEAGGTYCTPSSTWPCQEGQSYKGRGPKQLSYNYNYGQFSEEFCGDKMILLENPSWVESNKLLAWASAAWFWMTGGACDSAAGEICKPGVHEVFTGTKTMCPADVKAGRVYGLGWATNVVNGGLECGSGQDKCDYRVWSRVRFYNHFCDILGVSPLTGDQTDDNLFCSTQQNYVQSPPTQC